MKKLIIGVAFAAMLASPAFAQSYSHDFGTGNTIDVPALEHGGSSTVLGALDHTFAYQPSQARAHRAMSARARMDRSGLRANAMAGDPDAVYESNQYIGRDPDPNVRLDLRRDWTHE